MCDTWVALADATQTGQVIFAKNSDRPVHDCQPLLLRPRQHWPSGARLSATYVELPQAPETYAHLGSSPYWCWGYESGLNEHGLAIGNEAIFTRSSRAAAQAFQAGRGPELGLLGMDLIRLGLERARTAREAVTLLGGFVEAHGQFGSGSPGQSHAEGSYDNSFILADPREAWVLEAAGREWAARCLGSGYASISNQPTLRTAWDLASGTLCATALSEGWWPRQSGVPLDFARAYVDETKPRQLSHIRVMRSRQLLAERCGQINTGWMRRIARDHYEDTFLDGPFFDAADPDFLSLCMHASPGGFTWGNTASSCIAVLPLAAGDLPVSWWTPGPPCNGCYVPFFVHGSRLPAIVSETGQVARTVAPADTVPPDEYAPDSYWWLFRRLMDVVKAGQYGGAASSYPQRNQQVRAVFDALEADFEAGVPAVMRQAAQLRPADPDAAAALLDAFTDECVARVLHAARQLLAEFTAER